MLVEEKPISSVVYIPKRKEDLCVWVLCLHLMKVELRDLVLPNLLA